MKCYCGNTEFKYSQNIWAEIKICLGEIEFVEDKNNDPPEGPFRCTSCGREFDEYEEKDWSRGTKRRLLAAQQNRGKI
jgi:hypothetical protein